MPLQDQEAHKAMVEAGASPGETLEAAIQGICVVQPKDIGEAFMEVFAPPFQVLGWTNEEMLTVAAFVELVYTKAQEIRGV